jgi:hypothetical protein
MYLSAISKVQDTGVFLRTFSYIHTVPQITTLAKIGKRRRWSTLAYMFTVSNIGNTLLRLLN